MSYSDEVPNRSQQPVRGKANGTRRGEHVNPAFQAQPQQAQPSPAIQQPVPQSQPVRNTPVPAPRKQAAARQAQVQQQAVPTPQPRQPAPAVRTNSVVARQGRVPAPTKQPQPQAPVQQAPPTQQQQAPPTQRHPETKQAPATGNPTPAPAKKEVAPARPQTKKAEEPLVKSTVSVVNEPPKTAKDNSRHTFVSGSTGAKADPKELLLDTDGLVKIYDGRTVVNGVNINVKRGEIVGLLGPNGAGKTTSFYMMVGLVPPNGGRVMFDGKDVTKLPMYKRARLGMGYLPQEESIFRKLTVEENIMAVMQTMKYSRKEKKAKCDELLERFSITHIRKNIAMACSGGEKRRVTIARSLVPNPSLIMLDEPFGGVDPIAVGEIQEIVKDLRKDGLAVLITDHNARETLDLVDRAYLICEGKVLREGPKEFLVNDPVSRQLYLGERFSM